MRSIRRFLIPLVLLLAFMLPAGTAVAAPATSERRESAHVAFNTCNGEFVVGEGTAHTVVHVLKNGFTIHYNFHGQGIGSEGNEYVINVNGKGQFESTSFTAYERTLAISKGSAPNQPLLLKFDSSTGVTIETECRG